MSLTTTGTSLCVCFGHLWIVYSYLLLIFYEDPSVFEKSISNRKICSPSVLGFNLAETKGKPSGAGLFDCLLNYKLNEGRGTMFLFILVILSIQSLVFHRNMILVKWIRLVGILNILLLVFKQLDFVCWLAC